MNRRNYRLSAFLAVCTIAIIVLRSGTPSNNLGKLEGKWRVISGRLIDGIDPEQKQILEETGSYLLFEFRPDGNLSIRLESADEKIRTETVREGAASTLTARYRLLSGDDVEFTGTSGEFGFGTGFENGKRGKLSVKIEGDNMTITGSDGPSSLTRIR